MLSQKELKFYTSLLHKKYRDENKKFLVEGLVLIKEALKSNFNCELIITTHTFAEKNNDEINILRKSNIRIEVINQLHFNKLCDTKIPQGIIGVFDYADRKSNIKSLFTEKTIIALENIADPGNLGAIIRNCDWFGIKNLILSSDCAEIYNPKVIRASAGSVFHIDFLELSNFYDELLKLKQNGFNILCADLKGISIYNFKPEKKSIIVFSNEAHGPSEKLLKISNYKITIPRFGKAESLNVASATAIILSEFFGRNIE